MTFDNIDIEKINRLIKDELSAIESLMKVRKRINRSIRFSRGKIIGFQCILDKYTIKAEKE